MDAVQETAIATRAADGGITQHGGSDNPIGMILQKILENKIGPDQVDAVERLSALWIKSQEMEAKKAFVAARVEMAKFLPHINARKEVWNNGVLMYAYAPMKELLPQIQPILDRFGFAIGFSQEIAGERLVAVCTITHVAGHSEIYRFGVRAGTGTKLMSLAQVDAGSTNLAERHALRSALNLVDETEDDDARLLGDTITAEQAGELRRRLATIGRSETAFLKFAGCGDGESFEHIRQAGYQRADAELCKAEALAAKGQDKRNVDELRNHFSGQQDPDVIDHQHWHSAMEGIAAGKMHPGEFAAILKKIIANEPVVKDAGAKGTEARAATLAAFRSGKISPDGKIFQ